MAQKWEKGKNFANFAIEKGKKYENSLAFLFLEFPCNFFQPVRF